VARDLPNDRQPLDELNGSLRKAVEHVRQQPAPQDSMNRSVERARRIATGMGRRPNWNRRGILGLAGMAAAMSPSIPEHPPRSWRRWMRRSPWNRF
jgi:hypothetical protein